MLINNYKQYKQLFIIGTMKTGRVTLSYLSRRIERATFDNSKNSTTAVRKSSTMVHVHVSVEAIL